MSNILYGRSTSPREAELDEMREIFSLVDKDGGGTISSKELSELFSIVGIEANDEELEKMIGQMDEDNSGEIDFEGELLHVEIAAPLHITL